MTTPSSNTVVQELRRQIMENCHRSDARYAGFFSLCGLLLRLRDYFKWEMALPPWTEAEAEDVLAWIEARENKWDGLDEDARPLAFGDLECDPFDADALNRLLEPFGLYYSAGLAAFLKPSFCLAEIMREERLDGCRVLYLGNELARDLYTAPAQTRENIIVARRRPLAAYLWETILHAGANRSLALNMALKEHGLERSELDAPPDQWAPRFERLVAEEMEPFVRHEYAEMKDRCFPRSSWQKILGAHPYSRTELMARTIKDLLADVGEGGRLEFIIQHRRRGSLGIYAALLDGLPECVFPEFGPAFQTFIHSGEWAVMDEARLSALTRAGEMAGRMVSLFEEIENPDEQARAVEESFFKPIGL